jgi:AraC-like DNA-binding protein
MDALAQALADDAYDIEKIYRFGIPPNSAARQFRTLKHGFLFAIAGEADIRADGVAYRMRPGTVFHAAPDTHLEWQAAGEQRFEYDLLFYRLDKRLAGEGSHPCDLHFVLESGTNPGMPDLLNGLHRHIGVDGGMARLRVKQLFFQLLHQVLKSAGEREHGDSTPQRVMEEAVAYIRGHYMQELSLDELARLHAMSPKRFSYYFHKYIGCRPIDYMIQYRMEKAGELLRTSKFPIRDVASSVGYDNPLYFSRLFRKKFGMSPSAYSEAAESGALTTVSPLAER